ncbi:hypothetical protein [Elizabethkingia meningoseptica]|uniref:hypothetical protein n=1 Tax=Elizabethkingia meningoseptica TaxID=238 RepID=UPI003892AE3B
MNATKKQEFERLIISFDEVGYNSTIEELKEKANALSAKVANLCLNFSINITDANIKKIFVNREKEGFVSNLFKDQSSPYLRELALDDFQNKLANIYNDNEIYNGFNPDFYIVEKGKVILDSKVKDEIKKDYEVSLDSERAAKAHNLHEEIFQKLNELINMARESNNRLANPNTFFHMDRDFKLKKVDINYNKI